MLSEVPSVHFIYLQQKQLVWCFRQMCHSVRVCVWIFLKGKSICLLIELHYFKELFLKKPEQNP